MTESPKPPPDRQAQILGLMGDQWQDALLLQKLNLAWGWGVLDERARWMRHMYDLESIYGKSDDETLVVYEPKDE
jgi:hypothetical protein